MRLRSAIALGLVLAAAASNVSPKPRRQLPRQPSTSPEYTSVKLQPLAFY
jgi:hypothetical protein